MKAAAHCEGLRTSQKPTLISFVYASMCLSSSVIDHPSIVHFVCVRLTQSAHVYTLSIVNGTSDNGWVKTLEPGYFGWIKLCISVHFIQLTVASSLEHRSYCEVNEQTTTAIARAGYLIGSMIGVP